MTNNQLFRRIYVTSVAMLGLGLIIWSVATIAYSGAVSMLLQLMLLNTITQITSRNIAKSNIVMGVSQAVNLAAVAIYGVQAGVLVALVASSSVWLYQTITKQKRWRGTMEQLVFNNGMEIIAVWMAGWFLTTLLALLPSEPFAIVLIPWLAAAVVY